MQPEYGFAIAPPAKKAKTGEIVNASDDEQPAIPAEPLNYEQMIEESFRQFQVEKAEEEERERKRKAEEEEKELKRKQAVKERKLRAKEKRANGELPEPPKEWSSYKRRWYELQSTFQSSLMAATFLLFVCFFSFAGCFATTR